LNNYRSIDYDQFIMSLLRPATMFRPLAFRRVLSAAPRASGQVRWATQDYGSGAGDPKGENPQQQGKNPSEHLEHPGPAPPKVAQGKSSDSPNEQQASSNKSSQSSESSGSGSGKESSGKGVKGAQPKILNENPPSEDSPDVKAHNKEMENRAERAHEQVSNADAEKDKVPAGYWSGTSNAFPRASTTLFGIVPWNSGEDAG
jgi:hypothetical protein